MSERVTDVTDQSFESDVLKSDKPVLLGRVVPSV